MLLPHPILDLIDAARVEHPKRRDRDLAAAIGLTEAHLVAAGVGRGTRRITAAPAVLVPALEHLGDVMALTRNENCVHEKHGRYSGFQAGDHAAMVLGPDIDLRIFPRHWVHAFAVVRITDQGTRRSIQVFDACGEAVHKVFLEDRSDVVAFEAIAKALALPDDAPFDLHLPDAPEGPQVNADKIDALRHGWARMTDTHQFMLMTRRMKFDRLGAYRSVGAPWAQALPRDAVVAALTQAAAASVPLMIFVGNPGCIQIHSGPVARLEPMGPWFNVLDPAFNLHLRADRVAEVWLVRKPTKRGDAVSVEAFDAEGRTILQVFGKRSEAATDTAVWDALATALAEGVAA